ncbi:MAG: class I SAM-dependent methyltransferase [Elusimicrobiota bacterium]
MAEARVAADCAVCGGSRAELVFRAQDSDGLSSEPFGIVRCAVCGMVYVSPRPGGADLGRYYVRGYYDKPGEDSGGAGRRLGRLFMAERVAKAACGLPAGRVLDIGCGEGTFLAAMSRRGWDCWGVEVSAEGAARASARPGLTVLAKPLEECGLEPESFDLITLWHSIEHVPDPAALLRQVAALIKDDGRVFLAFPNAASWDLRLFGARWFHLDPPRHLHYFSPETMSRVLKECGLRAVRVSHFSLEYNPFGFVQSVLNFVTSRFNFLYRKLKGTLPLDEAESAGDRTVTIVLLPFLTLLAVPYSFLAALCGSSGCIDVLAEKDVAR